MKVRTNATCWSLFFSAGCVYGFGLWCSMVMAWAVVCIIEIWQGANEVR